MSNTATPAPAAAERETQSSGVNILDMPDDAAADTLLDGAPAAAPRKARAAAPDPTPEPEAPAAAEADEIEDLDETQAPSPESDEPDQDQDTESETDKAPKLDLDDDDATTHLRDRTKVTVRDLKAGYETARDLTQRVLPTIRQEYNNFQAARQAFEAQQQELQPVLANVTQILQDRIPAPPDPAMLDPSNPNFDPSEYSRLREVRALAIENIQTVERVRRVQAEEGLRQAQAQQAAYLQGQRNALVQRMPQLRDPEKAKAFNQAWQEVGRYAGFTPQEVAQVFDHRLLVVGDLAADGLKYRAERAGAKATETQRVQVAERKVQGKPPVPKPPVAPPAARTATATRENASARQSLERLRKTGSARDAEDFFSRFT